MFSFKKEAKVYIVYNGIQYNIDISEVAFGQTVQEELYSDKTLHTPSNLFDKVKINKANPAEFQITIPAIRESDLVVLFNRALDCLTFDLYVSTKQDVFKVSNCVITSTIFIIEKGRVLGLTLAGQGVRASREGAYGVYTIPGTPYVREFTRTYNKVQFVEVELNQEVFELLTTLTIELQNDISWVGNAVVGPCIAGTDLLYPGEFIVNKKILSGTVNTHIISDTEWSTGVPLRIQAGQKVGNDLYGFEFDLPSVSFTSRLNTGEIFSNSYDWRFTHNPESLHEVIKYYTLDVDNTGAILDYLNQPILDYLNQPILENL